MSSGESPVDGTAGNSFLEGIGRQAAVLRNAYPDLAEVSVDFLFIAFLAEVGRFGRLSYGPLDLDTRVIVDYFERTYPRLLPGKQWYEAPLTPSHGRFFRRVAEEVARSGRRRVDDLHWLLAFMRTPEGLPARVFGELAIGAGDVERFASSGSSGSPKPTEDGLERLYSPEEIAEYLGVHVQTVRAWVRSGKLPARRILGQRSLRIRKSDLNAVLRPALPGDMEGEEL